MFDYESPKLSDAISIPDNERIALFRKYSMGSDRFDGSTIQWLTEHLLEVNKSVSDFENDLYFLGYIAAYVDPYTREAIKGSPNHNLDVGLFFVAFILGSIFKKNDFYRIPDIYVGEFGRGIVDCINDTDGYAITHPSLATHLEDKYSIDCRWWYPPEHYKSGRSRMEREHQNDDYEERHLSSGVDRIFRKHTSFDD